MADNVAASTDPTVATDDITSVHYQRVKLVDGTLDSTTAIAGGGGVEAGALRVTVASDSTGVLSVDDNAASLTVDAPVATPVFVRLSDGAAAITTLPVSLAAAPSTAVTNVGTFATQVDGAALTSLQLIDDAVYASDAALSKSVAIGAVLDDAATVAITENQAGYLRMSSRRALLVEGVASGTALNVLDTNSAAALTAVQKIDDPVIVDDAAFTVGTSSVMMAGVQAVAHGANPDVADALDAGAAIANRHRIPFTLGGHPNLQSAEYFTSGAITNDNILPAISTGTIYVITCITVTCSNANVTSPSVRIGFGTASVPAQGATNADAVTKVVLSHPGIAPGSGIVKGNGSGIIGIGGDDEELRLTCSTPTTSMCIVVDYFTITS